MTVFFTYLPEANFIVKKYFSIFNFLLFIIFFIAFVVRVWGIDKYPIGFTQDEAGIGYDAYSLLKTGKDQWGNQWPLVLRSFGDFKMPLYSYLAISSIAFFGLNEFSTRLPNAIFGFFAVVSTYLLVSEMTKNKKFALFSCLILALSPWHISLSRGAFEANLTAFFMTAGSWLFLLGLKNKWYMLLSAIFLGLNLFSYHSARFVTPLIYFFLITFFYNGNVRFGKYLNFAKSHKFGFFIFILFLMLALGTVFFGGGKRGVDILITNPTDKWQSLSDRRYEAVLAGLLDNFSRIINNKFVWVVKQFYGNYLSYLSFDFLFIRGAGEWSYGMIVGRGVLYSFELVGLLTALIFIFRRKSFKGDSFIIAWILVSIIPAALTKGSGFAANRAAVMMPAIQIMSSYGVYLIYEYFSKSLKFTYQKVLLNTIFLFVIFVPLIFFIEDYIYHAPKNAAASMQYGTKDMMLKVLSVQEKYDEIGISRTMSVPHIWLAFYSKWDPLDYQKQSRDWLVYEKKYLYLDQLSEYRLGKYFFGDVDLYDFKNTQKILLVGKADHYADSKSVVFTTYYPNGNPAYIALEK